MVHRHGVLSVATLQFHGNETATNVAEYYASHYLVCS